MFLTGAAQGLSGESGWRSHSLAAAAAPSSGGSALGATEIHILNLSGGDYSSIGSMFSCVGYPVKQLGWGQYLENSTGRKRQGAMILVVPHEEALLLKPDQTEVIAADTRGEGQLVTDGVSPLSRSLGISFGEGAVGIRQYTWKAHPEVRITFPAAIPAIPVLPPENTEVLGISGENYPVMIAGVAGKGKFIYSSIPLAPMGKFGYEHFPFFIEAVHEQFAAVPVFSRRNLAFYVDYGFHYAEDPQRFVERLKQWGCNQVHLSAWDTGVQARHFRKEFIKAAHSNGMTVYAWLEYPMVSQSFWDEHACCREKTATGRDATVDWRLLIALEDPGCLELVKHDLEALVSSQDWDGIDLAELYFEPPSGFEAPDNFTPMHSSFRESFAARYGVDPWLIFQPDSHYFWKTNASMASALADYRMELIGQLNRAFLDFFQRLGKRKPICRPSLRS
jgi:hypothetical protein